MNIKKQISCVLLLTVYWPGALFAQTNSRSPIRPRLEATIPAQATKEAGTYPVIVVGEGDFASRSAPAYLIVSFKK
jgi:hypothetical protein